MATNEKKIRQRVRSAYVVSTVSIALVLFLLGAVGYLILNARLASDRLRENLSVSVWLRDGLENADVARLRTRIGTLPAVKETIYISKEQAAESFRESIDDEFERFLDENPLPASFEVTLHADRSNPDSVRVFEAAVSKWEEVDEVLYPEAIIGQISDNIRRFNLVILFFGGTLLLISLILINNTIRMTIFSKRFLINTMKLVGATRGFILRPFLWRSVAQGVFAALLAAALICAVIYALRAGIPEAGFISDWRPLAWIFGGLLAAGVLISLLFTWRAVGKYVRLSTQKIHIY
jgi:cell division transport system permease protein